VRAENAQTRRRRETTSHSMTHVMKVMKPPPQGRWKAVAILLLLPLVTKFFNILEFHWSGAVELLKNDSWKDEFIMIKRDGLSRWVPAEKRRPKCSKETGQGYLFMKSILVQKFKRVTRMSRCNSYMTMSLTIHSRKSPRSYCIHPMLLVVPSVTCWLNSLMLSITVMGRKLLLYF